MTKKTTTKKSPPKKKPVRKVITKELVPVVKELQTLGLPDTFFNSYEQQLSFYKNQRETITKYIKENLTEGVDFGYTIGEKESKNRKKTLMKAGAEKITAYMNCRVRFYPDHASWTMLGGENAVCFTAYLVDEQVLKLIAMAIIKMGIEHEERIVKLFAWGEGRGAYEVREKVYSSKYGNELAGQPLKGTYNRAIKIAEKRAETDLIIRVFGLDFAQDSELKTDDIRTIYSIAMKVLNEADMPIEKKKDCKYRIDNALNINEIEDIIDEMKGHGVIESGKDSLKLSGVGLLNEVMGFVNREKDLDKKQAMMKETISAKGNDEELKKLLQKYKGGKV